MARIKNFKNTSNAFNYVFEDYIPAGEVVLLKMPPVSSNKRGINDIGFMADNNITLYATISATPDIEDNEVWQEINSYDEINKTTAYLKIVNESTDSSGNVIIRVIMN